MSATVPKKPSYMLDDGLIEVNVKRYYDLLKREAENAALRAALKLSLANAKSIAYCLPVEKELKVEGRSLEVWINTCEAAITRAEGG